MPSLAILGVRGAPPLFQAATVQQVRQHSLGARNLLTFIRLLAYAQGEL